MNKDIYSNSIHAQYCISLRANKTCKELHGWGSQSADFAPN